MRKPSFTRKVTISVITAVKLGFKAGAPVVVDTKEVEVKLNANEADEVRLNSAIRKACGHGYVMGEVKSITERLYSISEEKFFECAELVKEAEVDLTGGDK